MEGFESYEYAADEKFHNHYFESKGPKGNILKKVHFNAFVDNHYNICLGDFDRETGQTNYKAVSNNSDMDKVFFTIAKIIYEFTKRYPQARIYFTGSTAARTRLYQIKINTYKRLVESAFKIYGVYGDEEETFISNRNYNYFFVFRKWHNN